MRTMRFANIRDRLIDAGLATPESFVGCTEEEIDSIESRFSIHLPKAYRDFLLEMGRDAGNFLVGMDYTFPQLFEFRNWAEQLLQEAGSPFRLPANAYVFLSAPGGSVLFFYCDDDDDPPVFIFVEGEQEPRKLDERFTEWVRGAADDHIAIERQIEKSKQRMGQWPASEHGP